MKKFDVLNDVSTILFAENKVDEGMALEQLLEEHKKLQEEIEKGPICPHCETRMIPTEYHGYYEQFVYWSCRCRALQPEKSWNGAYVHKK